jgi:ubiquinol-cytochrome c reductase cytochrome c subunit
MRGLVLLLAIGGLACLPQLAFAQAATAQGDAARGQRLFLADGCYECHGTVGQGGFAGPRLAPDPHPAEAISAYIRGPAGVMPPYGATVVSDADVADIQAYLASIKPPPRVDQLPQLKR